MKHVSLADQHAAYVARYGHNLAHGGSPMSCNCRPYVAVPIPAPFDVGKTLDRCSRDFRAIRRRHEANPSHCPRPVKP